MADMTFSLTGFMELNHALLDLGPRVANKIAYRGLKAGAEVIAASARGRCPVGPGEGPHLRDSIITFVRKADGSAMRVAVIGFEQPASRHAGFVEFGNSHQAAEPFMRPAIDANGREAMDILGDKLGEDIETAAAGYLGRG